MAFLERPISWGCWKKNLFGNYSTPKEKEKRAAKTEHSTEWMERKTERGEGETEAHTHTQREREMSGLAELSTTAVFYTWATSPKDQVVLWKRELLSINPSNIPRDTRQITTSRLCFSLQAHSHTCTYTLTAVNHHLLVFPSTSPSFRPSVSVWRGADNSDAEARGWHYTQHLVLHCLSMK